VKDKAPPASVLAEGDFDRANIEESFGDVPNSFSRIQSFKHGANKGFP
jgi:hypothetical protein